MPEQHRPRRGLPPFLLGAARDNGSLIHARCGGCSPARYYLPADLIELFGDIPVESLEYRMRCEKCQALLSVCTMHPTAAERMNIRLRRLDRVWTVRRASWRSE